MGGCFSDVKGGKQAIGGINRRGGASSTWVGGPNDAVDMFYRARGQQALFTPLEVKTKEFIGALVDFLSFFLFFSLFSFFECCLSSQSSLRQKLSLPHLAFFVAWTADHDVSSCLFLIQLADRGLFSLSMAPTFLYIVDTF